MWNGIMCIPLSVDVPPPRYVWAERPARPATTTVHNRHYLGRQPEEAPAVTVVEVPDAAFQHILRAELDRVMVAGKKALITAATSSSMCGRSTSTAQPFRLAFVMALTVLYLALPSADRI
jgi:hypothetical protein